MEKEVNKEFTINEKTGNYMLIYEDATIESNDIPLLRKLKKLIPVCPSCKSAYSWKHGYDIIDSRNVQKFKCHTCGHIWRDK